jgi:hypothetical protein
MPATKSARRSPHANELIDGRAEYAHACRLAEEGCNKLLAALRQHHPGRDQITDDSQAGVRRVVRAKYRRREEAQRAALRRALS